MKRILFALLISQLAGCSTTPDYDMRFGDAVRQARTRMTINPGAGANADPVSGLDGKAAYGAMDSYKQSFKAPPPVTNVINIGSVK